MAPPKVLLIEDNEDDEILTLRALRECGVANRVDVARDGAQALDYLFGANASDELPALVLLDLKLPKVSGLEVLERIRSDGRTKNLPVVVITSSDDTGDLARSYSLGANSYIRKHVDMEKFMESGRRLASYWLELNARLHRPPLVVVGVGGQETRATS